MLTLKREIRGFLSVVMFLHALVLLQASQAEAEINFMPEEIIQVNGSNLQVPGYSVPTFVDWNNDGKNDLIVGVGSGNDTNPETSDRRVRVYLNEGTATEPVFSTYFCAQSNGSDLSTESVGFGCLGLYPRVTYWDADDRKDLIIGYADGFVQLYLNIGTDVEPTFDGGRLLTVNIDDRPHNIFVNGGRSTPNVVDWNNDGKKDLVVGACSGEIYVFLNEGTDTSPEFIRTFLQAEGANLVVSGIRASPAIFDLDGDGNKDILTGNTYGQILFYRNIGTDAEPVFDTNYTLVKSDGVEIDLPDPGRSRPFLCDWNGDGEMDLLVGCGDGMVHLYQGVPEPATSSLLIICGLALLKRKRIGKSRS